MTEFVKEFEYHLQDPFEQHLAGSIAQVKFLTVSAPSNKQIKDVLKIKQGFIKSMLALGSKVGSNKDEASHDKVELTEEKQVFQTLFAMYASDDDLGDLVDCFKRILLNGCCKVDGVTAFTEYHYSQMSEDDFMNLFGRYVHTFLLSRFLKAVKA